MRNLEGEVVRIIRDDVAAARMLAGGADRHVFEMRAEFRAHTCTLNALRESQVERCREIVPIRCELGDLRTELGELRTEMRAGFGTVHSGMVRSTWMLEGIDRV